MGGETGERKRRKSEDASVSAEKKKKKKRSSTTGEDHEGGGKKKKEKKIVAIEGGDSVVDKTPTPKNTVIDPALLSPIASRELCSVLFSHFPTSNERHQESNFLLSHLPSQKQNTHKELIWKHSQKKKWVVCVLMWNSPCRF